MFLEGKTESIVKELDNQIKKCSQELEYEKAAMLRDKKIAIENLSQRQKMINLSENDIDVIWLYR